MAQVFISFIHEEKSVAEGVKQLLQGYLPGGNSVFLSSDTWEVYAGELWFERIVGELKEAKVVVSILSPKSVTRPWVNFEAGAAWIKPNTALIPACFGGLDKGSLPRPYSSLQALNLDNDEDQYYLLKSVCHYLKVTAPPPVNLLAAFMPENESYKEQAKYFNGLKLALIEYSKQVPGNRSTVYMP